MRSSGHRWAILVVNRDGIDEEGLGNTRISDDGRGKKRAVRDLLAGEERVNKAVVYVQGYYADNESFTYDVVVDPWAIDLGSTG